VSDKPLEVARTEGRVPALTASTDVYVSSWCCNRGFDHFPFLPSPRLADPTTHLGARKSDRRRETLRLSPDLRDPTPRGAIRLAGEVLFIATTIVRFVESWSFLYKERRMERPGFSGNGRA
jgi:hypothetical protein